MVVINNMIALIIQKIWEVNMNNKGVTLIELLVVIVILGLLALIGSITLTNVLDDTREEVIINEARVIENVVSIHLYFKCL